MSKVTAEHLARGAYVYIRQSTADQLVHNQESQRRQYGLADRARQLGWTSIEVIDDDLGRSGGGVARPGFEHLLAAICEWTSPEKVEGFSDRIFESEEQRWAIPRTESGRSSMMISEGKRCGF